MPRVLYLLFNIVNLFYSTAITSFGCSVSTPRRAGLRLTRVECCDRSGVRYSWGTTKVGDGSVGGGDGNCVGYDIHSGMV